MPDRRCLLKNVAGATSRLLVGAAAGSRRMLADPLSRSASPQASVARCPSVVVA